MIIWICWFCKYDVPEYQHKIFTYTIFYQYHESFYFGIFLTIISLNIQICWRDITTALISPTILEDNSNITKNCSYNFEYKIGNQKWAEKPRLGGAWFKFYGLFSRKRFQNLCVISVVNYPENPNFFNFSQKSEN